MYLNPEDVYKLVIGHITSIKPKINDQLSSWLKGCDYNAMNVSPRDLNYKFSLLSKVF